MMEPNHGAERVPDVDLTVGDVSSFEPQAQGANDTATRVDSGTLRQVLAFDEFYRAHRLPLARALSLTLRNTELAGEAIDEAMARAFQRWDRVAGLDNPGGWVYRVALNWSRSVIRRITRPAPTWVTTNSSVAPAPVQDPAIDRALDQLTVDQRAVIVCRLLLGWSEQHTAESLGIKPGTVKSRLHRALQRLTPLLAHLEETS
jgi:RNA polymerase sigma factor (sigma-70 family)